MPHVTLIGTQEQRLVERLQQADKTAAREFYTQYIDSLAGVCMRYIADEESLKDVLQNAFAHIFSHISDFEYRGKGSLLAWAKRIVVNESLKYVGQLAKIDQKLDKRHPARHHPPDDESTARWLPNGTEPLCSRRQEPSGDSPSAGLQE